MVVINPKYDIWHTWTSKEYYRHFNLLPIYTEIPKENIMSKFFNSLRIAK